MPRRKNKTTATSDNVDYWENPQALKTILIGGGSAGKSCLLKSMLGLNYTDKYSPTVQDEYFAKVTNTETDQSGVEALTTSNSKDSKRSKDKQLSQSESSSEYGNSEDSQLHAIDQNKSVVADITANHVKLTLEARIQEGEDLTNGMAFKDTGGQDEYLDMTMYCMRGADNIILCVDVTSRNDPMVGFESWIGRIQGQNTEMGVYRQIFVAFTKFDKVQDEKENLHAKYNTRLNACQAIANEHELSTYRVSAKTGEGVKDLVQHITLRKALNRPTVIK